MATNSEESQQIFVDLDMATEEFDVQFLEEKLGLATTSGVDPAKLDVYQTLFNQLQTDDFLGEKINELKDLIRPPRPKNEDGTEIAETKKEKEAAPDASLLKKLKNLIDHAERIGSSEEIYKDAKPIVNDGMRRRAKSTMKGSMFDNVDIAELAAAEEAFGDLRDFPNLKPENKWEGHRKMGLMGAFKAANDAMLEHSKLDICGSLTKTPKHVAKNHSITSFKNLLVWMGDKPAPEVARRGFAQVIVDLAKSDPALADEIYCQTIKQLTENPSTKSVHLGWSLMLLLCQGVAPSEELLNFVRAFMLRTLAELKLDPNGGDEEVVVLAKQCMTDLNVTIKTSNVEEVDESDIIPVQVMLIDSSTRKVTIASSSTLSQLGKQVAQQLKVHNADEFSFFQMIEGVDAHRLLPDNISLATLLPKWQALMSTTGKKSRLLWKRRFLRVDETLQAGDLMHARLTYQQALWDYLHYPISEDLSYICNIAAMVLLIDRDHYDKYIKEKRLHEPGVLELLLPDYVLRFEKRDKLGTQVLRAFQKLQGAACEEKAALPAGRLQRMAQVVSLMQRMRLFGTYCWSCKQVYTVPPEKVSLQEAPAQMCKINPKDPEAEYWICVDLFGVRFLSLDSQPGNEYMRGFLLRDESVERVLRWSAKQDVLQIIVQTYSQSTPEAQAASRMTRKPATGPMTAIRLPMTVAVQCSAAVDIAHTLQCAARERSGPQRR